MPYDNLDESQWPKMEQCVTQVMGKGRDKEGAIAICYTAIKADAGRETFADLGEASQDEGSHSDALAVKAVDGTDGELTLDILGVPYGPDRQGQIFDENTHLGELPAVPVYYHHGFDEMQKPIVEMIGWAVKTIRDSAGQWYRATLNQAKAIARKIYDDAKARKVRASSDSVAHLVRPVGILGKPGRVSSWPVVGLSLMDARTAGTAINPRAIAMPAVRAMFEQALSDLETEPIPGDSSSTNPDKGAQAAKAGARYSRMTRERMREVRGALDNALKALDGMMLEFPVEEGMDPDDASTIAAVTGDQTTQTQTQALAAKAGVLALPPDQLKALVERKVNEALQARGLLPRESARG